MQAQFCRVKHDPPNSYGDCIRACVASLLSLPTEEVPHFVRDNASGTVMLQRMRDYLKPLDLVPMINGFPATLSADDVLQFMGEHNPGVAFILLSADHAVVCMDGAIAHNPAWVRSALVTPDDAWHIITLVKDCGVVE